MSVIGLSAEVRVCTVITRETGGSYHVILDEGHFRELLMLHVKPPPASSSSECSLIRMGGFGGWAEDSGRTQVLSCFLGLNVVLVRSKQLSPSKTRSKKEQEEVWRWVGSSPSNSCGWCVCSGFPQHTTASLTDQDAKPSFSMA